MYCSLLMLVNTLTNGTLLLLSPINSVKKKKKDYGSLLVHVT